MDLKVKNSKIIIADVNDIVADIVMCEAYKLQVIVHFSLINVSAALSLFAYA